MSHVNDGRFEIDLDDVRIENRNFDHPSITSHDERIDARMSDHVEHLSDGRTLFDDREANEIDMVVLALTEGRKPGASSDDFRSAETFGLLRSRTSFEEKDIDIGAPSALPHLNFAFDPIESQNQSVELEQQRRARVEASNTHFPT
jgi:hypothetical protein